ncbi:MAG: GDP-mannose 4,6-dehydratase [Chloroflexi bacterium]|nr:GDP-mannose 4,6-dehydratase [Chloroflexota bacterium]
MKRILLTGATGFVGANLARRLLQDGHDLHLLVRPGYKTWRIEEIKAQVSLHEVELTDSEGLSRVVSQIRPEWVFHLATYGAYSNQADAYQAVQTNILGTVNLVEACLKTGFETFINTGSSSEYGFKEYPPSEREWLEPNSYYAVTKSSATLFCRYTAQRFGVQLATLRLYSVYGPYEEPTRLIPTLLWYGLQGKLPPLVNPRIARDYVYIEDVNEAYLLAATTPNQELGAVYNVGTGLQTTLHEVLEITRHELGVTVEPDWGSMPNRQWDSEVWVSDNRKIKEALNWQPRYTFEEGFHQMASWFKAQSQLTRFYQR